MNRCDVLVIGAGPAGMAAAVRASGYGLRVVILDEQPAPGGQVYRSIETAAKSRGNILGSDYLAGRPLVNALRSSDVIYESSAVVWNIEDDGIVAWSRDGRGRKSQAKRVIIAMGALERPAPAPGWTLPGVMTAGAAQILIKQSGVVPENSVIAGSGPLIYLIAQQLIGAGAPPLAMIETQTFADTVRATRHFVGGLRGWRYLIKGIAMLVEIRRTGVPRYTGCSEIRIEGTDHVSALTFKSNRKHHRIECQSVLLHQGVVPNTQATRALGLSHDWDARQRCFRPRVDAWGQTENANLYVAGDGAGIGGAKVAEISGALAAMHAATSLGALSETDCRTQSDRLLREKTAELAVRPFLDTLYPPAPESLTPADETIVCRCEEVTAGDIRRYAKLGCAGPNQTKAFGRPGMGPCQGRYCGLTVTELLSQTHGISQEEVGSYRTRMPLKPITLGELASIEEETDDIPLKE